ncbi:RopGEF8, partial [Trifolium pratense]
MFEIPGKHIQGLFDRDHDDEDDDDHSDDKVYSTSLETQPIGIAFNDDHVQEAPKMPPKPPT